jgi:hypothetical protein
LSGNFLSGTGADWTGAVATEAARHSVSSRRPKGRRGATWVEVWIVFTVL